MFVYRIKVTSEKKLKKDKKYKIMDLKIFKNRDLINKTRGAQETKFYPTKRNLTEKPVRGEKEYKSFILNRYNAHLLIEYLFSDEDGQPIVANGYRGKNKSKKNIGNKYSYAISFKPAGENSTYSSCTKYDAYLILKTAKPLNEAKINELNSMYRKITGREQIDKKNHKAPKIIKQMPTKYNKFDSGQLIFKKNSPVVLKSTIKQINDPEYSNDFYQEIYERNNVQDKVEKLYSYTEGDKRDSKSVYFIPEGTKGYKASSTTPIVELKQEDYLKMAISSLNLEYKNEKISNPHLSIIKVNKPNEDGYENMFNVFGVAFELKNASNEVFERANVNGLGHYTGFGFGFAYTLDQKSEEVDKTMKRNQNEQNNPRIKKNNQKNQYSHGNKNNCEKPTVTIEQNYDNGLFR